MGGLDLTSFCASQAPTFPESCLRSARPVQVCGGEASGREGTVTCFDAASGRFRVRLDEDSSDPWVLVDLVEGSNKFKFVHEERDASDTCQSIDPEHLRPLMESAPSSPAPIYDLAAVCKHIGDPYSGH